MEYELKQWIEKLSNARDEYCITDANRAIIDSFTESMKALAHLDYMLRFHYTIYMKED